MTIKISILKITTLLCLLLPVSFTLQAANITVKIDRNPVLLDESFHITYEADTNVDDDPDFSVISNHFDILNSSQSTNMRMINGDYSMKKTWDITLIGTKVGTFTIPSISFGSDLSPALRVKVAKNSNEKSNIETGEIFVEVNTNKKSAYIESEVIFTVRLLRSIEISQGSFSELETTDSDAIIINLGNVPQYTTTRNGKRYIVNEIRYAVYPQHSGKLSFKPLLFQGRISRNNSRSLFDQFLRAGEIKRIRSKGLSITIKAKPAVINTNEWLPVSKLSIKDEWLGDLNNVNVGEPITRTITLNVDGFTAEQLPELNIKNINGIKQYPDKAITENIKSSNGITASKQIKVAIIPTKAGIYTLPEISIPWWNTKTNRLEVAKLAAINMTAIGSANNLPLATTTPEPTENPKAIVAQTLVQTGYWHWVSLALASGWLLTVLYMLSNRSNKSPKHYKQKTKPPALKPFENAVIKACKSNNAQSANETLITWGNVFWPEKNINNLSDITQLTNPALAKTITELSSHLYAAEQSKWSGDELLKDFNHFKVIKRYVDDTHTSQLEPLYK